ncbi:ladinin-1 [Phyllostomus discolor]|uniref:Ladinin-1 n=1 Tax=Phyllostomus discolor TaxID=89673 RepID=A0A7E6D0K5_9CHIR|nr:ladinin-1 [Phyllostomus discolor]
MSGRKDWSALSSLARQRSLEDAEEQQREHRRRHRNLSSTADAAEAPRPAQDRGRPSSVRLPSVEEAEGPTPPSPGSRGEKEDAQAVPRTRQERRQRRQLVEVSQTPVRERLEAEEGRDGSGPGPAEQRPPTPKKEEGAPPRRRLSREQRGPWAREEENLVGGEPGGGQQGVSQRKPSAPEGVGALENRPSARAASSSGSSLLSERAAVSERKKTVLEKTGISEKVPNPRKTSSSERSLVSERTLLFEKSSTPETKLVPKRASGSKQPPPGEQPNPREQPPPWEQHQPREKPQPQEQPKPQEKPQPEEQPKPQEKPQPREQPQEQPQPREKPQPEEQPQSEEQPQPREESQPREEPQAQVQLQAQEQPVAGGGQKAAAPAGKDQLSSAEPGTCRPLSRTASLPPVTLKVKIPRKEEEEGTSPSPRATYSSSLQRSSPRTISFRMSSRTNSSETTLTRSASVRLPVKLGEKLERYQSAIQRSESIKALGASRTEFFVAPVGVASKRHLFEKELAGAGRTETAASRKENLKLSGAVTSRLKLWISRTQESREEDPQEVQGESAAARRTPGEKRADSSLDAEV